MQQSRTHVKEKGSLFTGKKMGKRQLCIVTMCCCLQMMGTDLLIALAMIVVWELPLICPILFLLLFGFIDSIFWTANLTKIPLGGWFAVTVAAAVCLFSYIWFLGTSLKRQYAVEHEVRLLSQRETHTLLKFDRFETVCGHACWRQSVTHNNNSNS